MAREERGGVGRKEGEGESKGVRRWEGKDGRGREKKLERDDRRDEEK